MRTASVLNRIGIGISKETDPDIVISDVINSAVSEAKLPEVSWVLIFFTEQHFVHAGRLHELIIEKTQCECIAGCSGMGVISLEEEITNGPGLVLMAGYTPEIRPLALAKYQELEWASQISECFGAGTGCGSPARAARSRTARTTSSACRPRSR